MANRRFTSQFNYSFERQPVCLSGNFEQTDLGAFAARTVQGITLTAVTMGAAGNSITIAFTAGGTAGAEVVSVSGNAISVQIESGVSTVTQVRTAINAAAAAAALVAATGTASATVATASALALQSGDDSDFDAVGGIGFELSQIGTGLYQIDLDDSYADLLSIQIMIGRSSAAVDLVPQMVSDDASSQLIKFRLNAGATPTNMANADKLYIRMELRNSSNPI